MFLVVCISQLDKGAIYFLSPNKHSKLNSSPNYENSRFSPQTFAIGSISFLKYGNGHFGPQTFASDSNSSLADSQMPFALLLSVRTACCWRIGAVGRPPLRWSRGLVPPSPSVPTPHPWLAFAAVAPKIRARSHRRRCRRGGFCGAAGGAGLHGDENDSEEQREQRVPQQLAASNA
jgi:hypothetical protein